MQYKDSCKNSKLIVYIWWFQVDKTDKSFDFYWYLQ